MISMCCVAAALCSLKKRKQQRKSNTIVGCSIMGKIFLVQITEHTDQSVFARELPGKDLNKENKSCRNIYKVKSKCGNQNSLIEYWSFSLYLLGSFFFDSTWRINRLNVVKSCKLDIILRKQKKKILKVAILHKLITNKKKYQ